MGSQEDIFFNVSVIIPTYNRCSMLGMTIGSFIQQDYPKDKFEIIIVDNNSTDKTKDVVFEWQAKSPIPLKYVFEPRQGVHYARNTAARYSVGDILYYTDDDMIADKSLIRNLVKVFSMGYNVASAGGKVLPRWEVNPPKWVLKYCVNGLLSLIDRGEELVIAPYDTGVYSCHQAMLRDAFFKSGGFNPENTAGEWIGDGETGLNIKLKDLGYKFAYVDDSIIYHMIPPSRMTQAYLNKRLANQGNCDSYTDYKKYIYPPAMLCVRILSHVRSLLKRLLRSWVKVVVFKGNWRLDRAYVSYYINRIKYDIKLIKDEDWRQFVLKNNWIDE